MIKKVLWVEDKPQKLSNFRSNIEDDREIELIIRKDAESAIAYLEKNIGSLSGAILDIEAFVNPDSEVETKTSFCRVRDCIHRLKHINPIEYFAFTGKAKHLKDKEGFKEEYQCEIFDKNSQSDEAEQYLHKIVDRHIHTVIEYKYGGLFGPQLGEEEQNRLRSILQVLEKGETRNADVFNPIRKMLDWVMEYSNSIGLLDIPFNGSNLSECSVRLGLKAFSDELIPTYIQRSFHSCVEISNNGSHKQVTDNLVSEGKASYLVRSTIFELLNILEWIQRLPNTDNDYTERVTLRDRLLEEANKRREELAKKKSISQ